MRKSVGLVQSVFSATPLRIAKRTVMGASATGPKRRQRLGSNFDASFYQNPILELEKYVEEPLLLPDERWFEPTKADMESASRLFSDPSGRSVTLAARAFKPEQCPNLGLPEVALMGYSNVGKSSLIAALFHRCPRLRVATSAKPGHTKSVDFFRVGRGFSLVDMPGYGLKQPESFAATVGAYLQRRHNIRTAFLLFNCEQRVKEEDIVVLKKLDSLGIHYALIMTKIDKFSRSEKLRTLLELRRLRDTFSREFCFAQPFLVSSHTGEGLGYLQAFIARLCHD